MCTVTFIPAGKTAYLCSNRDEQVLRAPAALPEIVTFSSGRILFPKDGQAGGTWIACHENGNAMVLLNGAFTRHKHEPPYRKSRGLIFLEIFDSEMPSGEFQQIDLNNIEPFTLIIYEHQNLKEAKWDGLHKSMVQVDDAVPHIWSSVTLYDTAVRHKREQWFGDWLNLHPRPKLADILAFHEFAGEGDSATDLRMNRDGILQTVSITGITLSDAGTCMSYKDLQADAGSVHQWKLSR